MHPTTLYAELTPNPNTMKFVADRRIFDGIDPVEYHTAQAAKGSSTLAQELFNFPFVKSVFISNNYVTLTKIADLSWDLITFELREFIREHLLKNEKAVEAAPEISTSAESLDPNSTPKAPVEPSEYDEIIITLLDQYVKPAVESDGGAIDFVSFKDGVVTVQLRGSCAGCPSSVVTLKDGIQNLLVAELPVVKEVVAESV